MAQQQTKHRRSRGDGAAYQRSSDGLWVASVNLGYVDGKRKRRVLYGKTKTEVLKKLRKAQGELHQRGDLATSSPTLDKWLDTWLTEIAPQKIKPKTLRTYRTYADQYLRPVLGKKKLDKITAGDVRGLHRYITNQGLSSTTALNAHRVLSAALRAAVRDDKVNRNVASKDFVDAPSKAVNGRTSLTVDQAVAVLRAAQDDRLASRWMFALMAGSRQGETLGLRWSHVDLDNGTAKLEWSLSPIPWQHGCSKSEPGHRPDYCPQRHMQIPAGLPHQILNGNLALVSPKSEKSIRTVPLAPPLWAALKVRYNAYLAERDSYRVDHGLVWPRRDGQPIDPRKDWQAWKDLLAAAGAPSVSLHEARHTTLTLLGNAGTPMEVAQQLAGHADAVTTAGYQHRDLTLARAAVGRLGDLLALD